MSAKFALIFLIGAVIATASGRSIISSDKHLFPLSIIHINDFHARFEQTNQLAAPCGKHEKCIGGYARIVSVVKHLLKTKADKNPVYLNAGDNFQGTIWYSIGRWNVTSHFLNLLRADAVTLGNHEFDNGVAGVVPFIEHLNSPVVVANMDASLEPSMQGKFKKSVIIERSGRKIGIIGAIVQNVDNIADTGRLKFTNESDAIREEAERLKTEEKVDIILVLTHCGLDVDRVIAKNAGPHIDVIVGGHSHTFLYTGSNPPGIDRPRDKYPVEVIQDSGRKVLIVQAASYAKYVGDLTVFFDEKGDVVSYEGAPIYLDTDVEQDEPTVEELQPWKEIMDAAGNRVVGETKVTLQKSPCSSGECNLGNLITDAMVYGVTKQVEMYNEPWDPPTIALINNGGIRTTLNAGELTYAHLVTAFPFENTINTFDILGKYLLETLEYSVSSNWTAPYFGSKFMLQVSGIQVSYNVTNPPFQRVMDVKVLCRNCTIPKYEPLEENKIYRVATQSFIAGGGDGFFVLKEHGKNMKIGPKDIDILVDYVKLKSPITIGVEGRINMYY